MKCSCLGLCYHFVHSCCFASYNIITMTQLDINVCNIKRTVPQPATREPQIWTLIHAQSIKQNSSVMNKNITLRENKTHCRKKSVKFISCKHIMSCLFVYNSLSFFLTDQTSALSSPSKRLFYRWNLLYIMTYIHNTYTSAASL